MRHPPSVYCIALTIACLLSTRASAQEVSDVRYWPLREINFPVPVERLNNQNVRPTKLRLFVNDRTGWKKYDERTPNDLELIDSERMKRGFRFVSPVDGPYDFALQLEYPDGSVVPREVDLAAQYRIVFDTRPPLVRVARRGSTTLEWDVTDEYLAGSEGISLEGRWVGELKFFPLRPTGFSPKPRDSYTWTNLRPGELLEVRVVARDRAGHETASVPITLPGQGDAPGLPPAVNESTNSFGQPNRVPNEPAYDTGAAYTGQPQLVYSATRDLTITSTIHKVTRSGIAKAHLWVKEEKASWLKASEMPQNIQPTADRPNIVMRHSVKTDGRYGFIVIPESGAGYKDNDPTMNQIPQFLIEVDTKKPDIENVLVKPYGMGSVGPRVEITWRASDKNLAPVPILLEWAERLDGPIWTPITPERISNTGRYTWEIEDSQLWQFAVRVKAIDLAGNEGIVAYKDLVKVDLETPKAVIDRVEGNQGAETGRAPGKQGNSRSNYPPEVEPVHTFPAPATLPVSPAPVPVPVQPVVDPGAPAMPKLPEAQPLTPAVPSLPSVPKQSS